MKKIKVLSIFGTRPEAIKMASTVKRLESDERFESKVCVTGQHREMLDQVLSLFNISPDFDLNIMAANQGLSQIMSSVFLGLENIFKSYKPDYVLVHGDTSTTSAAAMSAYYHQIKIGHIEAGLRTGNLYSPWPEEGNRRIVAAITNLHFAPTDEAKENLLKENVDADRCFVTGNTVIDSLLMTKKCIQDDIIENRKLSRQFSDVLGKKIVLITGHRRESFGEGFINVCSAIAQLAFKFPDVHFVYPVHLNPNVRDIVNRHLSDIDNVFLIEPQGYQSFVYLMDQSTIVLTDSGGIQEEAPALGKPVLVMRDNTERAEAIKAGTAILVGTKTQSIIEHVSLLLIDKNTYASMSNANNPYGDGQSSKKILDIIFEQHARDMIP